MHTKIVLLIAGFLLLCLSWQPIWIAAQANARWLEISQAMISKPEKLVQLDAKLESEAKDNCVLHWPKGIIAGMLGEVDRQRSEWSATLNCPSSRVVSLVHAGARQDQALALQAIQEYPRRAEGWLWLAEISESKKQTEQAIQDYQHSLQIDPSESVAWCRLGSLLRPQDLQQAKDAFLQCCYLGDPGSNGCYNAGRIIEDQGNLQEAIRVYKLAHWDVSRKRAADLEAGLTPAP